MKSNLTMHKFNMARIMKK